MNKRDVLQILAEAAPKLRGEFGVQEVYLFGSVARGDARPDSDVDLLVSFATAPSLSRFLDLAEFLEALLRAKVDLVTMAGARPCLLKRIEKEMLRAA